MPEQKKFLLLFHRTEASRDDGREVFRDNKEGCVVGCAFLHLRVLPVRFHVLMPNERRAGEIAELRDELNHPDKAKKKDAVKKGERFSLSSCILFREDEGRIPHEMPVSVRSHCRNDRRKGCVDASGGRHEERADGES